MGIAGLADPLLRRLGMRADRLAGYFARNVGEMMPFTVTFAAFVIEDRNSYEVTVVGVDDGVVRFSAERQRRFSELGRSGRVLSTEGFDPVEVELPLRDGDSVRSLFEMAVAAAHFGTNAGDLEMIDADHAFARAYRAAEARRGVPEVAAVVAAF